MTSLQVLDDSLKEVDRGTHKLSSILAPGQYTIRASVPGDSAEKLVAVKENNVTEVPTFNLRPLVGMADIRGSSTITFLQVLDDSLKEVDSGTHKLSSILAPGLYMIRASVPGDSMERLVAIEENKLTVVPEFNLRFDSNAPLLGIASENKQHQRAASGQSKVIHKTYGDQPDAAIFIFARGTEKTCRDEIALVLRDRDGKEVSRLPADGQIDWDNGWLALSVALPMGTYVLEQQIPGLGKRGQVIFAEKGCQTQAFAPWDNIPDFARATVRICELGAGFHPHLIDEFMQIEAALGGLTRGDLIFDPNHQEELLSGRLGSPMLGLIGAYSLLARHPVDYRALGAVVNKLRALLPHSPDVQLLSLLASTRGKRLDPSVRSTPFDDPPMLARAARHLLGLAAEAQELCPLKSWFARVAPCLTTGSAWTRWESGVDEEQVTLRIRRELEELAPDLTNDLIHRAARLIRGEPLPQLGRLALKLSLPQSVVMRVAVETATDRVQGLLSNSVSKSGAATSPHKATITGAVTALKSPNSNLKAAAAVVLGRIGPDARDAVPALIELLGDEDLSVRELATVVLGRIGPDARDAVPALIKLLGDEDGEVRRQTAEALVHIGRGSRDLVAELIQFLRDEDRDIRQPAATVLGQIGPVARGAVLALAKLLGDEDLSVTPPSEVALPFRPGSEIQGLLPTLPPGEGGMIEEYGGEVAVGSHNLQLEVAERDGELSLYLKSQNQRWESRVVWVALGGDNDKVITSRLVLEPTSTGSLASTGFGPVVYLRERLGPNLRWTVFPPSELAEVPKIDRSRVEKLIGDLQEELQRLSDPEQAAFWRIFMSEDEPLGAISPLSGGKTDRVRVLKRQLAGTIQGRRALKAVLDVLQHCATEARSFAIQRLKELVAEIRHRYWAPTAWLYVKEGDVLRAVVRRRTGRTEPTLHLDETSITTLVARTGKAYFTNDAQNDPHFRPSLPSQSVMAAPLKTYGGELVGALCLEAYHRKGRFSKAMCDDLAATVAGLVPHILVLKSLDRTDGRWCPWHPRVHKWDLALVLRRICHAIAEAIEGDITDGIECAVWSVDRDNRELYVYGVSGYGMEYIKDETLPFESFTGCVAECPAGTVGQGHPGQNHSILWTRTATGWESREGHRFLRAYKREFMGLTDAILTPIHLSDSSGKSGEARYLLGIYAYGDSAVQALPSWDEQIQIAEMLGDLISAYLEQRERLAAAYFTEMLATPHLACDFSPIVRELRELLRLEEVRIYLQRGMDNEPRAVKEPGSLRPLDNRDGNSDYLAALLAHPGEVIRINNEQSRRPDIPIGDAGGWLPWDDPDRRRFLDLGIEGFGVIRLVRPGHSKPFTPDDERLFLHLATVSDDVLRDWDATLNTRANMAILE
jgi:hypothetical protein